MDKNKVLHMAFVLLASMDDDDIRDLLLDNDFTEVEIEDFIDSIDSDAF